MPIEYPGGGVARRAQAVRSAVGLFDVCHLGKVAVHRAGGGGLRRRLPDQRPVADRARPGAVHAVLRRRLGRRRRRPDRLPAVGRRRPARPERGELAPRSSRRLRGRGPRRRHRHRPARPTWRSSPCRVRGADDVLAARSACPTGHDYMELRRRRRGRAAARSPCCRTGYTGERGYELLPAADVAPALWDALLAAGEPRGAACRAGSVRGTRCAPRWATRCTARTFSLDDHAGAGAGRLGGRLGQAGVLGSRGPPRGAGARGRRAWPGACWPWTAGIPRAGTWWCATSGRATGRSPAARRGHDVGHLLPDAQAGHRPRAARPLGGRRATRSSSTSAVVPAVPRRQAAVRPGADEVTSR